MFLLSKGRSRKLSDAPLSLSASGESNAEGSREQCSMGDCLSLQKRKVCPMLPRFLPSLLVSAICEPLSSPTFAAGGAELEGDTLAPTVESQNR